MKRENVLTVSIFIIYPMGLFNDIYIYIHIYIYIIRNGGKLKFTSI